MIGKDRVQVHYKSACKSDLKMSARLYYSSHERENGKVSFLLKIPNTPYSFVLSHVHVQTTVSAAKEISRNTTDGGMVK